MTGEQRGRVLVGAVCAWLALLWASQYHPFVFPNADYHSFERIATSFAAGEWPSQLKRGPILPALMALFAPLLPGRHAALHAALLLNLGFSLGCVVLLYRLARRAAGPVAGALAAILLATSSVHNVMALQPLVEPSLGFFALLAFVLLQAGSRWQYAAAAAAAASRPEALGLVGILALVNAVAEPARRWVHLGLGLTAALPALAWNALGTAGGSGAGAYVGIAGAAGRLAPHFLLYYWSELFAGFARHRLLDLVAVLALVGAPVFHGVRLGLAGFRREAIAALAWLVMGAMAVVVLGIEKPRYLHPTQWVVVLFFAVGLVDGLSAVARRPFVARHARALGAVALAALAITLVARVAAADGIAERTSLLVAVGLVAATLAPGRAAGPAALALWLAALCVLTPVLGGASQRTREQLAHVRTHRLAAAPAAAWLDANLGPGEVVATLHVSQVLWASDLASEQVVGFGSFEADDLAGLRAEMRRRGVSHAVYTWRSPPRTASQRDYDRRKKVSLAALFRDGGSVEGFDHVATLAPPGLLPDQPPAQVYRLAD